MDRDRNGRTVAVRRASGEDPGAIMVREGMAWAFVRYSSDHVVHETRAKALGLACMATGACRRGSGGGISDDDQGSNHHSD